uniref:Medium-chain acyl-CoA ligase ACSF2, mitochondrial n=1 Tax=Photinus pyralis TaxID=7054 RepID=A0A1Y1L3B5_PHOPY
MTSITFQSLLDDNEYRKTETVGYIMDHVEVKVVDRKGNLVPFGTPGELCVRAKGYWNDPEKTREVLSDRKWYRTGYVLISFSPSNKNGLTAMSLFFKKTVMVVSWAD